MQELDIARLDIARELMYRPVELKKLPRVCHKEKMVKPVQCI